MPAYRSSPVLPVLFISILLSSCSSFNCTRLENFLGGDVNLISLGEKITEHLVKDAMPPLMPRQPDLAILTSTFVNLDAMEETSRLGRLLQNHIGTRLVQLGYTVKEVNLRHTMRITPGDGETMLSRHLSLISKDQAAQAILVGTYSLNNRILYITAKLVNPVNRNIISAHSYRLCMDENLLAMFGLQRRQNSDLDCIDPPRESLINEIFY
ncbi:MAG: FlgO family outer membrane protein [Thermodesulfobacteriota bacterium]|nr:FlgO family outer membrane protein [Thermodesulfobacteriota bacterium]